MCSRPEQPRVLGLVAERGEIGAEGGAAEIVEGSLQRASRARRIDEELAPAYEILKVTINPIPIKAALNLLGHEVGGLRLPLVEATAEETAPSTRSERSCARPRPRTC